MSARKNKVVAANCAATKTCFCYDTQWSARHLLIHNVLRATGEIEAHSLALSDCSLKSEIAFTETLYEAHKKRTCTVQRATSDVKADSLAHSGCSLKSRIALATVVIVNDKARHIDPAAKHGAATIKYTPDKIGRC